MTTEAELCDCLKGPKADLTGVQSTHHRVIDGTERECCDLCGRPLWSAEEGERD